MLHHQSIHGSPLSWASWHLLTTTKKLLSTEACQIRFSQHVNSVTLGYEMRLRLLPYQYTWKMFLLHEKGKALKDECMHAHASGFLKMLINHCWCLLLFFLCLYMVIRTTTSLSSCQLSAFRHSKSSFFCVIWVSKSTSQIIALEIWVGILHLPCRFFTGCHIVALLTLKFVPLFHHARFRVCFLASCLYASVPPSHSDHR